MRKINFISNKYYISTICLSERHKEEELCLLLDTMLGLFHKYETFVFEGDEFGDVVETLICETEEEALKNHESMCEKYSACLSHHHPAATAAHN